VRRFVLITMLLGCVATAGCAPTASERLVGKWEWDLLDRAQQARAKQEGTGGMKETLLGIAEAAGLKLGMQIEFRDDQTVTMSASLIGTATSGPMQWKVAKVEEDTVTVEIRRPNEQSARSLLITFVDEDHFQLTPPGTGDKSLLFTRVKQE